MTDNCFAQTLPVTFPYPGTPIKTVLCHGCFDLLHLGHIKHLQEAKAHGDKLVVSVTADPHVGKGIGRPHFTAQQRVEALLALECVDDAFINESGDAVEAIKRVRPSVYVKGIDYAGKLADDPALMREVQAVESLGGKFVVTKSEKWSSTKILNAETLPENVLVYLDGARKRGFLPKIKKAFELADKQSIVFVGETICDEYRYVRSIGKPAKENCLAVVEINAEHFDGGVVAASRHAEWQQCKVVTTVEEIHKTRLVDADYSRKLFEIYKPRSLTFTRAGREKFNKGLSNAVNGSEVVVVFDFGHGLIDAAARRILSKAKFLAVNAQSNAGNYGFNPITNYVKADLICIDDPEARLAAGNQFGDIGAVISELSAMHYGNVIVTHGSQETTVSSHNTITYVPALSTHGVDTMGAGDAFLAVAAPLVAAGLELEAAAFVGNIAGAAKCAILGHRRYVTRNEIMQTVEALLS